MQSSRLHYLESRIEDHERDLTALRREIQDDRHANAQRWTEEFRRRAMAIGRELAGTRARSTGPVADPSRKRRNRLLSRRPPRDRMPHMDTSDVIRRNTEAFERHAAAADRHAEAADRVVEASDRVVKASDRAAEASDRLAVAADRQRGALIDQLAELKRFGSDLERRTSALLDSFAMLAGDVRKSIDGPEQDR